MRVTYLGVNGYQFEANGHALLVDPYFTRAGLRSIAFQQRLEPNEARIGFGLRHVRSLVDAVRRSRNHEANECAADRGRDSGESDQIVWARS